MYLGNRRKLNTECFKIACAGDRERAGFINRISESDIDYGEWYDTYLDLLEKQIISSDDMTVSFFINPAVREYYNNFFVFKSLSSDDVDKNIDQSVCLIDEQLVDLYRHIFSSLINYIYMNFRVGDETIDRGILENTLKQVYDGINNGTDITLIYDMIEKCVEGCRDEELRRSACKLRDGLEEVAFDKIEQFQYAFKEIWSILEKAVLHVDILETYFKGITKLFEALYAAGEYIIPGVDSFKLIMKSDARNREVYDVLKRYTELMKIIDEIPDKSKKQKYKKPILINEIECSMGEYKMITLLSAIKGYYRQFVVSQCIGTEEKNFIVLVDEIEDEMHLEWSRTLLYNLSKLLEAQEIEFGEEAKYLWYKYGFRIQLIFTTHSPFILSDLKKTSIIALEKEEGKGKKQDVLCTFAQNIQKIMAKEFFIDDCYGELAQTKIQEIIEMITSKDNISAADKGNIEMTLSEIGEPIVRKKLKEMFYKKTEEGGKRLERLLLENQREVVNIVKEWNLNEL